MAASRPDSIARASNQAIACLVPVSVAAGKRVSPQRFQCSKSCFAAVFDHAFIAMSVIFQRESRNRDDFKRGKSLPRITIADYHSRFSIQIHPTAPQCQFPVSQSSAVLMSAKAPFSIGSMAAVCLLSKTPPELPGIA